MNRNRILFHDALLQRFDWSRFNETTDAWETGHAEIEQLGRVFEPGTQVSVYLAQQMLLQTEAQMPPRAGKQQLNAIAYAIEDQLAEDVEDCFFAVYQQQDDNTVPVVVINQQVMDKVVSLLSENHLIVRHILPQIYLCPMAQNASVIATICAWHDGYLIRTDRHRGLYCQSEILSQVLKLVSRQAPQDSQEAILYADSPVDLNGLELEVVQQPAVSLLTQQVDEQLCINLKQKQYQSSHQWMSLLRLWKWPAGAFALLLIILVVNAVLDVWKQKETLNDLVMQQKALLQRHLPELAEAENPRRELTRYLADHRGSAQQAGFLDQLYEYVRLKTGLEQIITGKIQYQKSSLVVDLESKDLKSLESLRAKLGQSSFSARIDNVNISPEKTTGRLVMEVK
jgi:general secretion pathway protein L